LNIPVPEPSVLLVLDSLNEVLANDLRDTATNPSSSAFLFLLENCREEKQGKEVEQRTYIGGGLGVSSLAQDDVPQLFLVPLVHRIRLLVIRVELALGSVSLVRVKVSLLDSTANVLVVRELALEKGGRKVKIRRTSDSIWSDRDQV
jgi:hypothetical protein